MEQIHIKHTQGMARQTKALKTLMEHIYKGLYRADLFSNIDIKKIQISGYIPAI